MTTPHPPQAVPLPPLGKANCGKRLSLAENLCHRKRTNKPTAGKCRNCGGSKPPPYGGVIHQTYGGEMPKFWRTKALPCDEPVVLQNDGRTKALPYGGDFCQRKQTCDGGRPVTNNGGNNSPQTCGGVILCCKTVIAVNSITPATGMATLSTTAKGG